MTMMTLVTVIVIAWTDLIEKMFLHLGQHRTVHTDNKRMIELLLLLANEGHGRWGDARNEQMAPSKGENESRETETTLTNRFHVATRDDHSLFAQNGIKQLNHLTWSQL